MRVTVELPDDFLDLQGDVEALARELCLAAAVKWHELGRISESDAAEIAGISRQAFSEALHKFKVPSFLRAPDEPSNREP